MCVRITRRHTCAVILRMRHGLRKKKKKNDGLSGWSRHPFVASRNVFAAWSPRLFVKTWISHRLSLSLWRPTFTSDFRPYNCFAYSNIQILKKLRKSGRKRTMIVIRVDEWRDLASSKFKSTCVALLARTKVVPRIWLIGRLSRVFTWHRSPLLIRIFNGFCYCCCACHSVSLIYVHTADCVCR